VNFLELKDIPTREIVPGYTARFVHTDNMTFAHWDIKADHPLPRHTHPHEQVAQVLEGRFEMTIEGRTQIMEPGMVAVIPPEAPHSGRSLTDCRILDVFYPVRQEYT